MDVKLKYSNISALLYAALNTSWYWYILTSLYFDKFSQKSQISWDKVTWLWQLTYYFQSKTQNFSNFQKLHIYTTTLFKMWYIFGIFDEKCQILSILKITISYVLLFSVKNAKLFQFQELHIHIIHIYYVLEFSVKNLKIFHFRKIHIYISTFRFEMWYIFWYFRSKM